ncbi:MAG: hypothetical protein JSV18_07260 [Candidatus Bathyarchaeota archaeon]|nr:MAG: hypothetical protein JSV18_07260 [Candidatus Bathyarchaeota archaeon]
MSLNEKTDMGEVITVQTGPDQPEIIISIGEFDYYCRLFEEFFNKQQRPETPSEGDYGLPRWRIMVDHYDLYLESYLDEFDYAEIEQMKERYIFHKSAQWRINMEHNETCMTSGSSTETTIITGLPCEANRRDLLLRQCSQDALQGLQEIILIAEDEALSLDEAPARMLAFYDRLHPIRINENGRYEEER